MDALFFIQLFIVLACIGIGGRYGGMGLGAGGGLGVAILVLGFGLKPSAPSITAMLIIICVIGAVNVLQAAGGLDYLVRVAEKLLRKKPQAITFVAPILTSIFTLFCVGLLTLLSLCIRLSLKLLLKQRSVRASVVRNGYCGQCRGCCQSDECGNRGDAGYSA
ncbi:anaerobic C4-dicarboxylate transporter family protein [Enterobacter sp. RHBSTW-01064]|uniref:anaerobic C4-dicarboxylate transporter family protein n=1 Tax=Enterobacter sp. RHBSTW-01064 TaxID=2742679 RepID=UPI00201771DC|nr:anaerobic C4-dicarboxylate transporter family protein [Enterobacter sp. RHBSTW-01064]